MDNIDVLSLKDRDLRDSNILIAEGKLLVERAFIQSLVPVSVYCTKGLEAFAQALYKAQTPSSIDTLHIISESEIARLAGFPFHRGILGIFQRPSLINISDFQAQKKILATDLKRIVVLSACQDQENLGAIARSASAFNFDAMILGKACADPYGRKALRASMGANFSLPLFCSEPEELQLFLQEQGIKSSAFCIDFNALHLKDAPARSKEAVFFGNEFAGLGAEWKALCDRSVFIPISKTVDSLNVSQAAAIVLHEYALF